MADRRQEGAAHLVGLGEDAGLAGGLGEVGVLERRAELGDHDIEQAAFRGIQLAAVQLEHRARCAVRSRPGAGRMRPSRTGSPSVARTVPSASTSRTPVMPNASRARLTRAGTALSPRSTLPATVASSSASAAARCAIARSARGLVDDVADEDRDDDVEDERQSVPRIGDRDGEQRSDEEVVEREPREHGGEEGGPDAADERDDDHEQLVGQHVGGDRVRGCGSRTAATTAAARRRARQRSRARRRLTLSAPPVMRGRREAVARGGVGHDVHVDVAGLADHRRADARPGRAPRRAGRGG